MQYHKFILLSSLLSSSYAYAAGAVHHDLVVTLTPSTHRIEVQDTISFTDPAATWQFDLNSQLTPQSNARIRLLEQLPAQAGVASIKRYELIPPTTGEAITLRYTGEINQPNTEEQETTGIIAEQGIYLANSSVWFPIFKQSDYLTFKLQVNLPEKWQAVSQGKRSANSWEESNLQDEIYLIAAPFNEYQKNTDAVQALAFLRTPDTALAQKYLDITAQYIEMYRQLIGPYPYNKFALVENFWETGYGMPSFTLLGEKVIRLPFIIHSSYPHEILHNWWGNSVYVDYSQGNWSEGLTSYLADHLLQEQQGNGTASRRTTLQNYADFVSSGKDFAISSFTAKHSSSSEAVGYGKTQFLFHMLRLELGDKLFIQGLQRFNQQYRFKKAGFSDLASVFSQVANQDLKPFFNQWVSGVGAPTLQIKQAQVSEQAGHWQLSLQLAQTGTAYQLNIPLSITLQGQEQAYQTRVTMHEALQTFLLDLPAPPLRVDVDPEFDVFRRVDRSEIPAALSQAFGAEQALLIIPASASPELQNAYRNLARDWSDTETKFSVLLDNELQQLPSDRTVWLLGWQNRFANELKATLAEQQVNASNELIQLAGLSLTPSSDSVVLATRNHANPQHAIVWLAAEQATAIKNLARRLPHYRKYSYLAFNSTTGNNKLKGLWSVVQSPLSKMLTPNQTLVKAAPLKRREALIELPNLNTTTTK